MIPYLILEFWYPGADTGFCFGRGLTQLSVKQAQFLEQIYLKSMRIKEKATGLECELI